MKSYIARSGRPCAVDPLRALAKPGILSFRALEGRVKTSISVALATAMLSATAASGQAPGTASRLQAAPGIRVNADYMVGGWSDREDCGQVIRFLRDGRFVNPDGTSGTWRLDGDRLSFIGSRTLVVRLVPRSRNETIVVQANGTLGYSQRCS